VVQQHALLQQVVQVSCSAVGVRQRHALLWQVVSYGVVRVRQWHALLRQVAGASDSAVRVRQRQVLVWQVVGVPCGVLRVRANGMQFSCR
jgi:hypothetical protein